MASYERGPLKTVNATNIIIAQGLFSSPPNLPSPYNINIKRLPFLGYWQSVNEMMFIFFYPAYGRHCISRRVRILEPVADLIGFGLIQLKKLKKKLAANNLLTCDQL